MTQSPSPKPGRQISTSPADGDTSPSGELDETNASIPSIEDDLVDETSGEIQGVLSLLNRVRITHPDSERLMFSGSSMTDLNSDFDSDTTTEIPLPTHIGRFEIQRRLGEGGYGQVLLAWDPRLQRSVALKIPRAQTLITLQLRKRFLQEATAAAALSHPNIVPVFEAGRESSLYYIASRYCAGLSLAEWLKKAPDSISMDNAVEVVSVLAEAVQHAHDRGVLHRDLKPANVLMDAGMPQGAAGVGPDESQDRRPDLVENGSGSTSNADCESQENAAKKPDRRRFGSGSGLSFAAPAARAFEPTTARITDFGLASVEGIDETHTRTGAILGTPGYISPEQADGQRDTIGPATDTYALGVILYELLTGTTPFRRDKVFDTLQAVRTDEPKPPGSLNVAVPSDLDAIVLKCLEKKPAARYESAFALKQDLDRFREGVPVQARHITRIERLVRMCRRNPVAAGSVATISALILCLAIGSTAFAIVLAQRNQDLSDKERESLDHLEAAISAEKNAQQKETLALKAVFEARVANARVSRSTGRPGQRTNSLDEVRKAALQLKRLGYGAKHKRRLRNEAIAALQLVELRRAEAEAPPSGEIVATDYTAEQYVSIDTDQNTWRLSVRRFSDHEELHRIKLSPKVRAVPLVKLSPDRRFLVAAYNLDDARYMEAWDLSTGKSAYRTTVNRSQTNIFDINVDSWRLAFIRDDGDIEVLSLPSFKKQRTIIQDNAYAVEFDPGGIYLAVLGKEAIDIIRIRTGTKQTIKTETEFSLLARPIIKWSPDGKHIAVNREGLEVRIWNRVNGKPAARLSGHGGLMIRCVSYHPGGQYIATSADDGTTRIWNAENGRPLLKTDGECLGFSRDGRWLAMSTGRIEFIDPATTFQQRNRKWTDLHPSGHLAIVNDSRQMPWLFDVASGQRIEPSLGAGGYSTRAFFTPDGRNIIVVRFEVKNQKTHVLYRLPIQFADADASGATTKVGPPIEIARIRRRSRHQLFAVGNQQIAIGEIGYGTTFVLLVNLLTGEQTQLDCNRGFSMSSWLEFSDDGTILANGSSRAPELKLWNLAAGQVMNGLLIGAGSVRFKPDSHELLIATTDVIADFSLSGERLGHENPLKLPRPGPTAYSKDGRLIACKSDQNIVRLIDADTFENLASLPLPGGTNIQRLQFADGGILLVRTNRQKSYVWNLKDLRSRLGTLGLDWEHPEIPGAPGHSTLNLTLKTGRLKTPLAGYIPPRPQPLRDKRMSQLQNIDLSLQATPADPELWIRRCRILTVLDRTDEAIKDAEHAIELAGENTILKAQAFVACGNAKYQADRSNLARAIADLNQAVELDPANPSHHNRLAWLMLIGNNEGSDNEKLIPQAAQHVAAVTSSGPLDWPAQVTLGLLKYRQGEFETSRGVLLKSHRNAGEHNPATHLYLLAMVNGQIGNFSKANLYLNAAIGWIDVPGFEPDYTQRSELTLFEEEARRILGKHLDIEEPELVTGSDRIRAGRTLATAVNEIVSQPNRSNGWRERARALISLRKLAAAVVDCDVVVDLKPDGNSGYYWRGTANQMRYRFSESIPDFEKSVEIRPDDYWPFARLAWSYSTGPLDVRNPERALECAQAAMQLAPDSPYVQDSHAAALTANGQYQDALTILQKTERKDPGHMMRQSLLVICQNGLGHHWKALPYYVRAHGLTQSHIPRQVPEIRNEAGRSLGNPKFAASSFYSKTFSPERAFDGYSQTRWNSRNGTAIGEWLHVTWDDPKPIERIVIRQAYDRIRGFRILTKATNTADWQDTFIAEGETFSKLKANQPSAKHYNDKTVNPVFDIKLPAPIKTCGLRIQITSTVEMAPTCSVSITDIECN